MAQNKPAKPAVYAYKRYPPGDRRGQIVKDWAAGQGLQVIDLDQFAKDRLGAFVDAAQAGSIAQGSVLFLSNEQHHSDTRQHFQRMMSVLQCGIDIQIGENRYSADKPIMEAAIALMIDGAHAHFSAEDRARRSLRAKEAWRHRRQATA